MCGARGIAARARPCLRPLRFARLLVTAGLAQSVSAATRRLYPGPGGHAAQREQQTEEGRHVRFPAVYYRGLQKAS